MEDVDVVVVGGGQAGVALSHYLKSRDIGHVVLERDRPFSSWHNRWDGFKANTPNWMNTLPVLERGVFPSNDPKSFATREEIVHYLEKCLEAVDPPLRMGTEVRRASIADDQTWEVQTTDTDYRTRCVAVCSGAMSSPRTPVEAVGVPDSVPQMHSSEYGNPDQIETGSVLIVGTASSGVQIGSLLCESGRFDHVNFAASKVLVLPGHVFGIQTHRLIHFFGLFDVRKDSVLGKLMYSGLETRGDPIMRPTPKDLKNLHGNVGLYGRLTRASDTELEFSDGQTLGLDDLTIIWCTGFRPDYPFVDLERYDEVFHPSGSPRHVRGVVDAAPGLYFVGLRHQYTVASHDIYGVAQDAEFVAGRIHDRLAAIPAGRS